MNYKIIQILAKCRYMMFKTASWVAALVLRKYVTTAVQGQVMTLDASDYLQYIRGYGWLGSLRSRIVENAIDSIQLKELNRSSEEVAYVVMRLSEKISGSKVHYLVKRKEFATPLPESLIDFWDKNKNPKIKKIVVRDGEVASAHLDFGQSFSEEELSSIISQINEFG